MGTQCPLVQLGTCVVYRYRKLSSVFAHRHRPINVIPVADTSIDPENAFNFTVSISRPSRYTGLCANCAAGARDSQTLARIVTAIAALRYVSYADNNAPLLICQSHRRMIRKSFNDRHRRTGALPSGDVSNFFFHISLQKY